MVLKTTMIHGSPSGGENVYRDTVRECDRRTNKRTERT